MWLALVSFALLVLALLWLRARGARAEIVVPDPLTPEMLAPVRDALTSARRTVLESPDSAAAWGGFAEVCDAHHLYPEAELAYRRASALDPRDFRWVYGLALVRDFMGAEAEEVARHFELAVELQPRYPPARLRQGDALVRQGRLAEARAAYEEALELDPDFAMAHRNLGQTLLALDDVPLALAELERAAELDPSDGVSASSLANAYWRAGDAERAEAAESDSRSKAPVFGVPDPVRFAIDGKNVTPLASDRRAREREEKSEWSAALPDLQRLVATDPDDAALRARLGRCLVELGETERGRAELERALTLRPEHLAALTQLADLLEKSGDLARAADLYRRATALAPGSPA
ncbi:MAG: tetratricopeptide repeat protein, partial [Planctomycetes bacterium]|nr:tetratricopeptide repeat protein [Planctomycetota bacterium]